ncbi:MAG: PDZ domain-containing protein [Moraxellaceae bacterium]
MHGTSELPLAELLAARGVEWTLRAAESSSDAGGKPGGDARVRASLGAKWQAAEGGVQLGVVFSGGAAQAAGLSAGDVIVAIDGLRMNVAALERLLAVRRPGDQLAVHAFRRDELMTFTVVLAEAAADTCVLQLPQDAQARHRVEAWILGR